MLKLNPVESLNNMITFAKLISLCLKVSQDGGNGKNTLSFSLD